MRFSNYFKLKGHNQGTLDFVDVNVHGDVRLYIDPAALRHLGTDWGRSCTQRIRSFFDTVVQSIKAGDHELARHLLTRREPNETRLGMSIADPQGRAVGEEKATLLWESLRESQAIETGLLADLEDSVLLVDGVGPDLVSDLTTNIIRVELIAYTQDQCELHGIPLTPGTSSGPLWSIKEQQWETDLVGLPMTNRGPILLVPKSIVRSRFHRNVEYYYRHYILEALQEEHLSANTALVQLLKGNKRRVTKQSIMDQLKDEGQGAKKVAIDVTHRHRELIAEYRAESEETRSVPLSHAQLAKATKQHGPDLNALSLALAKIGVGKDHADAYHNAAFGLLGALFHPDLGYPKKEQPIHDGRKRIDITYANLAIGGFFQWLAAKYNAPYVFIECKNYTGDPKNPELDQLTGRFGNKRGKFGILLCRKIADKPLFRARCKDAANDDRGFVIALDDDDVNQLVQDQLNAGAEDATKHPLLFELFRDLVM